MTAPAPGVEPDTVAAALVTAVVVNYRTPGLVRTCLDALSLQRADVPGLRAIVVDGGSADGSDSLLAALALEPGFSEWVTFRALGINGGFGWANNEAFRTANEVGRVPEYFFVINPDATTREGALVSLVKLLASIPTAAVAGSLIHESQGRAGISHFDFPTRRSEFARGLNAPRLTSWLQPPSHQASVNGPQRCDWVSGASFLVRSTALEQCGGFDEGFFLYFEEVELMGRLSDHGWEVWHVPESVVDHVGGASTGVADGASAARRLPSYWHESRWRYFVLRHSAAYALAASIAWAFGRAGSFIRELAGGGRKRMHAPYEFRDMWSFIFQPGNSVPPAIGAIRRRTGAPPAWMADR